MTRRPAARRLSATSITPAPPAAWPRCLFAALFVVALACLALSL